MLLLTMLLGCCECFTPLVDRSKTARPQSRSFRFAGPTPLYQTTKAADDMSSSCDVAIFGGGFGGLYTALELSQRDPQLDIALIEPNDQFVFLPLLYDLSMGYATDAEVCPLYRDILLGYPNIRHVKASLHSMTHYQQACLSCNHGESTSYNLNFKAAVISVGASPQSLLETVPGADDFCQPFYTAKDARRTKRLIEQLERQYDGTTLQIAVVGGGYGGVELASCVARKFGSKAKVTLVNRSDAPPMAGTRAESVVTKALQELNIQVQSGTSVKKIERLEDQAVKYRDQYRMFFSSSDDNDSDDAVFDAIFWTAGSAPAPPVSSMDNKEQEDPLPLLQRTESGRLCIDENLQCQWKVNDYNDNSNIFACGDCAEIPNMTPAVPKTAQAAMQQSSVVAHNVAASRKSKPLKTFQFQDLGSMLTLGGASGAIMAPQDGSLSSLLESALSVTSTVLQEADSILTNTNNPVAKQLGLKPENLQKLGLTLGGYATSNNKGTLSGAVSGAARRAVYAARMPTNSQRGIALTSSVLSTAVRVAQEVAEELNASASSTKEDGDTLSSTNNTNGD